MKYQINQNQCGFLLKDGCFVKTLYCGTYRYIKALGYEVKVEEMEGLVEFSQVPKEILLRDKALAGKVLDVLIPEGTYRCSEKGWCGAEGSHGYRIFVLECVEAV